MVGNMRNRLSSGGRQASSPGIRMAGMSKKLAYGSLFHNFSFIHYGGFIGKLGDNSQVVGDENMLIPYFF